MHWRSFRTCLLAATLIATSILALPTQGSQAGGDESSDRITREVRHELLMQSNYTLFDWLAYKVNGNAVTLLGQVTNPALKRDAEASVKHIEGVESVQNDIEVLPSSSQDDRIRHETYRAIYGSSSLFKYAWGSQPSIHIIVKNGRVTLKGNVDSQVDKQTAYVRARGVPGVFGVENQLQAPESKSK